LRVVIEYCILKRHRR